MRKVEQLHKAKALLNQAMIAAANSMPNDRDVQEARNYIKRAIVSLEEASKGQIKKASQGQNQFQQWWGSVQSGVASANYSETAMQANVKSLAALDAMISEEQKKLNDLETDINQVVDDHNNQLID